MSTIFKRLSQIAEFIAAMALAAIFFTFIIQIFTRYAAKIAWMMPIPPISQWMTSLEPIGWTVNLISLLWVWIVFFGGAFIVRDRDHVTFDIIYLAVSRNMQRILAVISTVILIAIMLYAFPDTWDAIMDNRLKELKKIPTLSIPFTGEKIPMKWLFVSFIVLMVAAIVRAVLQLIRIVRYGPPETALSELLENVAEEGKKQ